MLFHKIQTTSREVLKPLENKINNSSQPSNIQENDQSSSSQAHHK